MKILCVHEVLDGETYLDDSIGGAWRSDRGDTAGGSPARTRGCRCTPRGGCRMPLHSYHHALLPTAARSLSFLSYISLRLSGHPPLCPFTNDKRQTTLNCSQIPSLDSQRQGGRIHKAPAICQQAQ